MINVIFSLLAAWEPCDLPQSIYGIPTWYKYLQGQRDALTGQCQLPTDFSLQGLMSFTSIGLAIIEILLRVVGIVAVGFMIYGGFQYITSQGDPERTRHAKDTILNALIGLIIAIFATTIVSFIARRLV